MCLIFLRFCTFVALSYYSSTGVVADSYYDTADEGIDVEENLLAKNEKIYSGSDHNEEQYEVLAGNYGDFGVPINHWMKTVYNYTARRASLDIKFEGRSLSNTEEGPKTDATGLVPIQDREYPYGAIQAAIKAIIDQPDVEDKTGPLTTSYQILKCLKKISLCALMDVASVPCFLHCITGMNPMMAKLEKVIPIGMSVMCGPLGTLFDEVLEERDYEISKIKRVQELLDIYGTDNENFRGYAYKAVESLHTQAIKYTTSPDMITLRQGLASMTEELSDQAISFQTLTPLSNPGCMYLNVMNTYAKFIDIFNEKPRLMDSLLPGYNLAKIVSNYLPGRHQTLFTSFFKAVNIITGANCGLVYFAEQGTDTECAGGTSAPTEVIENSLTSDTVKSCGTVPSFPSFSWNLGFRIPLFKQT